MKLRAVEVSRFNDDLVAALKKEPADPFVFDRRFNRKNGSLAGFGRPLRTVFKKIKKAAEPERNKRNGAEDDEKRLFTLHRYLLFIIPDAPCIV